MDVLPGIGIVANVGVGDGSVDAEAAAAVLAAAARAEDTRWTYPPATATAGMMFGANARRTGRGSTVVRETSTSSLVNVLVRPPGR